MHIDLQNQDARLGLEGSFHPRPLGGWPTIRQKSPLRTSASRGPWQLSSPLLGAELVTWPMQRYALHGLWALALYTREVALNYGDSAQAPGLLDY